MAEQNEFVGLHEVAAVVVNLGGRGAQIVEHQHLGRDPLGIEANTNGIGAQGGDDQPRGIERLVPAQCDDRIGGCPKKRNQKPEQDA